MFYCLIVGGRKFNDYALFKEKCDLLLKNHLSSEIEIVSGGAKGTDSFAETYATERGYRFKVFEADWDTYGKRAGFIRNDQMHKYIAQFEKRGVIAFWDGISKGTAQNFPLATKYGNLIRTIYYH